MASKKTIAVDFDGVISHDNEWNPGELVQPPITGSIDALLALINRGYEVIIFTARPVGPVRIWMEKHWMAKMFKIPEVTNTKPVAMAYIDDRAVLFTNWPEMLEKFPWQ